MNYKKPLIFILFCSITIWLLSILFTELTFSSEVEVAGDPHSYDNVIHDKCDKNEITKNLHLTFRYKYPLVNFKGKLEVFDLSQNALNQIEKDNREGRLIYSGPYKKKMIIEKFCFNPKIEETFYRDLQFVFSDKNNVHWFNHPSDHQKGYPFLKYKKLNIMIDWFSLHPSKPYKVIPFE